MKMCQAFAQEGHSISLVGRRFLGKGECPGVDVWTHYGIQQRFPLWRIPEAQNLGRHPLNLFSAVYAYLRRCDLVYARNLAAARLTAAMGIPTIFETHAPIGQSRQTRYFRRLVNAPGFRHIVVITRALKAHYLAAHASELGDEDVVVAPDGVDLERFNSPCSASVARERLGMAPDRFTVGYAGHLYPGRGGEIIVEMASRLPDVMFLVIGGLAPDIEQYQAIARRRGLSNLLFVGFIPNGDLPQYLFACDVLVMPYQRKISVSSEGRGNSADWASPMKMFEYMAAERPIITSDIPVFREVLTERNAILCDPTDAGAWCRAVEQMRRGSIDAKALSRRAREDVEKYTWRRRIHTVLRGDGSPRR